MLRLPTPKIVDDEHELVLSTDLLSNEEYEYETRDDLLRGSGCNPEIAISN